ncbi:hypothetical protein L5515_004281 [Caenorhabditis briggsae]|uniref:Uncharacterized protein n=1 Tax=Caenorhabditis briggsae TaxID=6238 RepID=A0AAE9EH54_CAEBR|nr:hypothetical protein L5515_004281 [Caenorhabditis briggsae]
MNILGLLLLLVLAIAAPIAEAGRRCRSSHQCDYQSVCYNGYCYTIDEMFEKKEKEGVSERLESTRLERSPSYSSGNDSS